MTQTPSTQGSTVALRQLFKTFDGKQVLSGLDLEVGAGEFLAVVGPSGSGKTTMMRIIGGFESPDSGEVEIAGRDVTDVPAERRNVNTVFQSYALFPHLNVLDNVAFGPRMHGMPRAERERRARELLAIVRLDGEERRMPAELSGGMQQRVALARALANAPEVLLLDEPLGALDRKLREELQRELRRVQSELGCTFIYVTHDQEEAFGMADRLAVMRDGGFEQVGDPGTVYDQPTNAWVALFVGNANAIPATLTGSGGLMSAVGPLAAGWIEPGLAAGDEALAIVRLEATRIAPAGPAAINAIPAHLVDAVAIGPSLRLRAVAGDQSFEAIVSRAAPGAGTLKPGDPVLVSFDPAVVRAYRPDAATSSSSDHERQIQ